MAEKLEATALRAATELAVQLITAHKLNWCRARLFHALAAAHKQGILVHVLRELFEDTVFEQPLFEEVDALDDCLTKRLAQWKAI